MRIFGSGRSRIGVQLFVLLVTSLLVFAACGDSNGGDDESAASDADSSDTEEVDNGESPDDEASADTEDDAADTGNGAESGSGPSFDLSGQQLTFTHSQPEALGMTTQKAMDILEEWGAEIERVELTETTGIQALLAGQTDFAAGGSDELVLGAAEGADVTGFVSTRSQMDYVMVAQQEIETVADLEGKTIGMSGPAGFDALLSRMAVRDAGLDESAVNFSQIGGSGDRAATLLAGRIDAAVVFISDWFELEPQTDDLHDLLYMSEVVPDFTKSLHIANSEWLSENAEVATAVACADLEANRWFQDNRQEWVDYTVENAPGATEDVTDDLYDLLIEIGMFPTAPEENLSVDGMQGLVDLMVDNGDIAESIDAAEYVDTSYLEEASEMGCGAE